MYFIRQVEPADLFAVSKIAHEILPERYNPAVFTQFYESALAGFFIAEQCKKIIGFLIGTRMNPECAKVLMLAVNSSYQRRGIGSSLLARYIQQLKTYQISYVELEVRTSNTQAIHFYQKHQFKITDTIAAFYQDGSEATIMRRVL